MISEYQAPSFIQLFHYAIVSLLLLVPFQIYFDVYGSNSLTLSVVLQGILLGVVLLSPQSRVCLKPDTPLTKGVYLFAGSLVLSNVWALDYAQAAKYSLKWVALISVFFIIRAALIRGMTANGVLAWLTVAACVSTAIGLVFYLLGEKSLQSFINSPAASLFIDPSTVKFGEINWFRGGGTGGTFFNRNWYAAFLGIVIPYAIFRFLVSRYRRILWSILLLFLIAGLLVSLSRGGWIGFMVVIAMAALSKGIRIHRWMMLTSVVCLIILFLGIGIFMPELWSTVVERTATVFIVDQKINRIAIWSSSLNMIPLNPITGVGIANNPIGSAHSVFLQIAVELGFIGLISFIWLLAQAVVPLIRYLFDESISQKDPLILGLLGSWLWFIFQGMLSTTLFNDKMFIAFFIIAALTEAKIREVV